WKTGPSAVRPHVEALGALGFKELDPSLNDLFAGQRVARHAIKIASPLNAVQENTCTVFKFCLSWHLNTVQVSMEDPNATRHAVRFRRGGGNRIRDSGSCRRRVGGQPRNNPGAR